MAIKTALNERELAARFGVTRRTVQHWRMKGNGPRFMKFGRAVRYPLHEVERFEREALRQSTSDTGEEAER